MTSHDASATTRQRNATAATALPWPDTSATEDAKRGWVAAIEPPVIHDRTGRVVWDLTTLSFAEGPAPATVHPSLWRLAELNRNHGLFQVTDRVYQVRGYDAANMTVVLGDKGFIVIDPLTCVETSAAALALAREHLGDRPVTAVVHTHCHIDHFGGVKGVVDEQDVRAGRVPVVAPTGFYEHAVSENVTAGPAMGRRAAFMFGGRLPRGPRGHATIGIAAGVGTGTSTLIRPTELISATGQELVLDGVRFVFQFAPDTEAPAEVNFQLPELRALCMAETVSQQMHNLYTLRGAPVRDALAWSNVIDEAITLFGDCSDVLFNGHQWPVWDAGRIAELLGGQRDLYRYIHDETLRLANHGHTPNEVAELIELPPGLAGSWANRGCYGSLSHNAKGVYQRYLGWFDGNPANLNPLPPADLGRRFAVLAGGVDNLVAQARTAIDAGDYRWATELLKHALAADPAHEPARTAQAEAFEQLGYQSESGAWRNFYLVGAMELRQGVPPGRSFADTGSDLVAGLSPEMVLDHMAIRLNGPKAGLLRTEIRLEVDAQSFHVTVANGVLRHRAEAGSAPTVLRVSAKALVELGFGSATLDELVHRGVAEVEGDRAALDKALAALDTFTGAFDIVTPNDFGSR